MTECSCLKSSGCAQCGTLEYVCIGIEIYWQDCSKTHNRYIVDEACHDVKLIGIQISERVRHRELHKKVKE